MEAFNPKSKIEQLTDHLRNKILSGSIDDVMPGVNQLVKELEVGTNTVLEAVAALEDEGLLENRGGRRARRIVRDARKRATLKMKVSILLYEQKDVQEGFLVDLQYRLQQAGHAACFSSKSLLDLGMNPERVARYVKKTDADAWVVYVGSRPVLEWFARQDFPSFALVGRGANVDMPGITVSKVDAMNELLGRLVHLGHRKIVLLTREERRKPDPGLLERSYLAELKRLGIFSGSYNLPDWANNPDSFQACLESLFPTARKTAEKP